jgi:O-antigen biosynthesis protein
MIDDPKSADIRKSKVNALTAVPSLALAEKQEQIEQLEARLRSMEQAMAQRDELLRQMAVTKDQLHQEMRIVNRSMIWLLVKKLYNLEQKLFPYGTKRGEIYYALWENLKTILSSGRLRSLVDTTPQLNKKPRALSSHLIFSIVEEPKVSIIIPVFNKFAYTHQCLQSVLENTTSGIYEIIVVDNASNDDTQAMLKSFRNINVISNVYNLGFVDACNQGAAAANGKYLLFLNNDTLVTSGWLDAMVSVFHDEETVGAVGAKLVYPDGKLQEAGGIIWRDGTGWNYGRGKDPNRPEYNYVKEVDYCSGACLMVKTDLFRNIGLFDRRYAPCFFEDTDLAFAIRDRGYKVLYQPKAVVIHYEGVTAGKDVAKGFKRYQEANRTKFVEKWRRVLDEQHIAPARDLSDPIAMFARERGFHKRILIVDHYVPEYDKDSGSLRMYEYIRALVELGHKIVFLPDNRFRSLPYTDVLQQLGVEVIYGHIDFEDYIAVCGNYFDVAYLSRPDVATKYLDIIKRCTNLYTIYDTVDLRYLRERRKAQLEGNEQALQNAESLRRAELYLASQSDMTLVVSEVEKEVLQRENAALNVRVVPHVYRPPESVPAHQERDGVLFIGGFTHDPNVDGIRWFAKKVWPRVREDLGPVKLFVVGSNTTKEVMQLNSESVIVTGFLKDIGQVLTSCRVFVAPLRYGAGVKGKILQAMSYGLPVVTTAVGAEGLPLEHGSNALIAQGEEEFAAGVARLYRDEELWQRISANSLDYMKTNHTLEACKKEFAEILAAADRPLMRTYSA